MKPITNIASVQEATGESTRLPAGGYICKYTNVEDVSEKSYLYMEFDIAEGEYKDFYQKQFDTLTTEDKHWPYDAVHNLPAPDDNSPQWMIDSFGTFIAALEDSNTGYHWDWDETKWKGLVLGALFRIEQTESNGSIYDHTRPFWFRKAQDVREGKFGRLPKDKLVEAKKPASDDFISVPEGAESEIPF